MCMSRYMHIPTYIIKLMHVILIYLITTFVIGFVVKTYTPSLPLGLYNSSKHLLVINWLRGVIHPFSALQGIWCILRLDVPPLISAISWILGDAEKIISECCCLTPGPITCHVLNCLCGFFICFVVLQSMIMSIYVCSDSSLWWCSDDFLTLRLTETNQRFINTRG